MQPAAHALTDRHRFPLQYRSGTIVGMKEDIHIRVDAKLMVQVRKFAQNTGVSLASAVSILLMLGLQQAPEGSAR
jgi:hypothetical protein